MEKEAIKNVVDFKYNDFEIGDKIKFGKWNEEYGNEAAIWTVLKKIDFSNLSNNDNRWFEEYVNKNKKYEGKALIVRMHAATKVYYGVDFIKNENLPHGGYLNFHFYNEWFDKENFPIVLNSDENGFLLQNEVDDPFISFDGDNNWGKNSDYLGKDLLFEEYNDRYKLLYYVGEGDKDDLEYNWNIDVTDTTKDGLYKCSSDDFGDLYFKTNSIAFCRNKCGYFEDSVYYSYETKSKFTVNEYQCPHMEEYTAFYELFGWNWKQILELLKDCKEDEEDFYCGKSWYNIIKLLLIKVKD